MGKIVFVVPYPEMGAIVEKTFHEEPSAGWELHIELVVGVRDLGGERDFSADVVVARGVTAVALKRMLPDTPIVDLPVSGYDILRAVTECKRRFAAKRIGIVGSRDMIYGADGIGEILDDVELVVTEVRDEEEAEPVIREMRIKGVDVVIGGVMSTDIAKQMGMKSLFIQTGREAIFQALREAKRVAVVRRQEQERGEQFRAILEYSAQGIVAVDAAGAISLANKAALELTNLPDEVLGLSAEQLLPELGLHRMLANGRAELGEIETLKGQQLAVNRAPITIGENTVGAVATFQPVVAIQELEGKIRRQLHDRGLVARFTFRDILGKGPAIRQAMEVAREFSRVDSNVLIVGETGSGKELFAQSIHSAGKRSRGPFVAINCAALPENLLESELFGYAEGAFTGALKGGKMGLFELAHGGTLFLDEISEISPKLQGRLLRALQEREIMRLGDNRVIPVNARIIAATNRDLTKLMQDGQFREDLYYRVDVLRLHLPSLCERREDIALLMQHFLQLFFTRHRRTPKTLSDDAKRLLKQYPWPGNIRELRNMAERLVVLTSGSQIESRDVERILAKLPEKGMKQDRMADNGETVLMGEGNDPNQTAIMKVLAAENYHYGKAAARLGISRVTLWRRLQKK